MKQVKHADIVLEVGQLLWSTFSFPVQTGDNHEDEITWSSGPGITLTGLGRVS